VYFLLRPIDSPLLAVKSQAEVAGDTALSKKEKIFHLFESVVLELSP
jgi:hypothetical protein